MGGYAFACFGPSTMAKVTGGPVNVSGTLAGIGHLTGSLLIHKMTPTKTFYQQAYTQSGGVYVFSSSSSGSAANPLGEVQTTLANGNTAEVFRSLSTYTVAAGDSSFVGKEVYLLGKPGKIASKYTPEPMDLYTNLPAIAGSFANCIAGTYAATVPAINVVGGNLFYAFDLGFTLPSVGSTFSVGAALQNDVTTLLTYTGSSFFYNTELFSSNWIV